VPKPTGELFQYEEIYEWFAAGNRGTIYEVAERFNIDVLVAYANCNFIAGKYQVPLYSNNGVYAIHWNVDELQSVMGKRALDVARRLKKGVRITIESYVEMASALPPKKRAAYLEPFDMFLSTCKFLVKQADGLELEAPKEEEEE